MVIVSIKKTLDSVIYENLRTEIISGRWHPGQQILIDELADMYGVSRTPVIQAARMMAIEGMFNIKKNGRIEIPVFNAKQLRDIYDMRVLLEEYAIKTICENRNDIEVQNLMAIADECIQKNGKLGQDIETRKLDLKLHRHIVRASGNECLLSSYIKVQGQFMTSNYLILNHNDIVQGIANNEHFDILNRLAVYDYEGAREQLRPHILSKLDLLIQRLEDFRAETA